MAQKNMNEITYPEAAAILGCSLRNAHRLIGRSNVNPIRYGYKRVRFKKTHIVKLKREIDARRRAMRQFNIAIGGAR
jgi:hypothetical protein